MSQKLKCLHCNKVIQSTHRHDFQACNCWEVDKAKAIAIDGGDDYCRMFAGPESNYIEAED